MKRSVPTHEIISIHAPTRGATSFAATICKLRLFQSTLLQEERRNHCTFSTSTELFQSTLLQEERLFR